jgi:hypothetical protein
MSKLFALLAVALIATGLLVLAVPPDEGVTGARPQSVSETRVYLLKAREVAEQVNAPLSIFFGLVSLFYSRRSYHINKARAEAEKARST